MVTKARRPRPSPGGTANHRVETVDRKRTQTLPSRVRTKEASVSEPVLLICLLTEWKQTVLIVQTFLKVEESRVFRAIKDNREHKEALNRSIKEN